jgi:hypothetical protein
MDFRVLSTVQTALGVIEGLAGILGIVLSVLSLTVCSGLMGVVSNGAGDGVLPGLLVGGLFGLAFFVVLGLPSLAAFAMAALRAATVWYLRCVPPTQAFHTLFAILHFMGPMLVYSWVLMASPLVGVLMMPVAAVWILVSVWSGLELLKGPR